MRNRITIVSPMDAHWEAAPTQAIVPDHPPRDGSRTALLTASMQAHGWYGYPVIVDQTTKRAWNASHRLAVAKTLDFDYVPVVWLPEDLYTRPQAPKRDADSAVRIGYALNTYGENSQIGLAIRIEQRTLGGLVDGYLLAEKDMGGAIRG